MSLKHTYNIFITCCCIHLVAVVVYFMFWIFISLLLLLLFFHSFSRCCFLTLCLLLCGFCVFRVWSGCVWARARARSLEHHFTLEDVSIARLLCTAPLRSSFVPIAENLFRAFRLAIRFNSIAFYLCTHACIEYIILYSIHTFCVRLWKPVQRQVIKDFILIYAFE